MLPSDVPYGERLMAPLIDSIARDDPHRPWASVPRDDRDLSRGFVDISFRRLAGAVNRAAWWLKENVPGRPDAFETVTYVGPRDLRYPILAVAAAKAGKQLLLLSPFATSEARQHLLNVTGCRTYLHAAATGPVLDRTLADDPHMKRSEVPELSEWLGDDEAPAFAYDKSWQEARQDPCLIFHTSGTTGLPKPIFYTNEMMTSLDAARTMPDAHEHEQFPGGRWYTPMPALHFVGMTVALQFTVFLDSVLVIGPADAPPTPAIARQVLESGNVQAAMLPPSLIEAICADPDGLRLLRGLGRVYFAGAPLSASVAKELVGHTRLRSAIGSTEAGNYFVNSSRGGDDDDEAWQYHGFRPAIGVELEERTPGLHELVFVRRPELARWQQIFRVHPGLDRFPTKDLWEMHPTKPGLWRYAGRIDDIIVLSHGGSLRVSGMEAEIEKHPDVAAALIGGHGRPRPFLVLEWKGDADGRLDRLWPALERANGLCSDYVRLSRPLVLFADPARPLVRTAKGAVSRQQSLKVYADDLDRLYGGTAG